MKAVEWTAIVCTTQCQSYAQALRRELEFRQEKGYISKSTLILCVEDPHVKVGSGGATLNALLVVAEHLSALSGHTVVTLDVLKNTRILLCHVGTHFPFSACQRGLVALPVQMHHDNSELTNYTELPCILDLYLNIVLPQLAQNSPPGLWICSTDRIICLPSDLDVSWEDSSDVRVFTLPKGIKDVSLSHGGCKIDETGTVVDILYNGSQTDLEKCQMKGGEIPTLCGILYMSTTVAETLLSLHVRAPLEACTYMGLDSDVKPIKNLSLFYDMLLAMASGVSEDEFVAGRRSGEFGTRPVPLEEIDKRNRKLARQLLWDALRGYTMTSVYLDKADFHYVYACAKDLHSILSNTEIYSSEFLSPKRHLVATIHNDLTESKTTIINSIIEQATLGEETVICHSNIPEQIKIGKRCLLSNLLPGDLKFKINGKTDLGDDLVVTGLTIDLQSGRRESVTGKQRVLMLFGLNDVLTKSVEDESSTFCNEKWDSFFSRTGIVSSEVWSLGVGGRKCLMNARIFPVFNPNEPVEFLDLLWLQGAYKDEKRLLKWRNSWRLSISDLVNIYDAESELKQRSSLLFEIGRAFTEDALVLQTNRCLLPFFRFCALEGFFEEILACLDTVGCRAKNEDRAVLSRTLACIADAIGVKANNKGGLRSGPAANLAWQEGLELLKNDKVVEAINFFAKERKSWLSRPDLLVRAARHYEGAFQIQVRKAVSTARQFIVLKQCETVPVGKYVTAEAPARVDIAGTWSDTPPICYEHGGSVITAGVKIDSKKPIGCRVRRIPEPHIVLILGKGNDCLRLECNDLGSLTNYNQVNSPGTVLKAAFFCAGILSQDGNDSLHHQLMSRYQSGFELQTWSELPHGSGLGTSSILAGTIIAALWRVVGKVPDVDSVIHAVLDLEQMITTGGGWQDNVGGLAPGIKEGSSKRGLPLEVKSTALDMPKGFMDTFEKHLVLVFSGKTRLARNMLQDVLRNWNARLTTIVETADKLVENAKNCIAAFSKGDLKAIGETMNTCWDHKKLMAPGCEPEICRKMINAIDPLAYGQCLAGAGGGGFMYVITKKPNAVKEISDKLAELGNIGKKATVHYVEIDHDGLKIDIEQ